MPSSNNPTVASNPNQKTSSSLFSSSVIGSSSSSNNNNKKYSSFISDLLEDDLINARSSLDPFHDMELKTINDFEELKNILTNHNHDHQVANTTTTSMPAVAPAAPVATNPSFPVTVPSTQTPPTQMSFTMTGGSGVMTNHYNHRNLLSNNYLTTSALSSTASDGRINGTAGGVASMLIDNFGLPKISFVDLDLKK